MKKITLFLLFVIFANAEPVALRVYGAGNITCAKYLDIKSNKQNMDIFHSYLLGFATGRSYEAGKDGDHLHGFEVAELQQWITKYCEDNPLDIYYIGITTLYAELEKRDRRMTKSK